MDRLYAGAARVRITPEKALFPFPQKSGLRYTWVHDDIYVRALVLNNGKQTFVYAGFDLFDVPHTADLKKKIACELHTESAYVLLADSYNHGAPRQDIDAFDTGHCGGDVRRRTEKFFDSCADACLEAVKAAGKRMEPVLFGAGAGKSHINVFRDVEYPDGWGIGADFEGPSDKALHVMRFDRMDGTPLAFWLNYAIYGNMLAWCSDDIGISGDIPGAALRFIEEKYGGTATALWSGGAAGDQDPIVKGEFSDPKPSGDFGAEKVDETAAFKYCANLGNRLGLDALKISRGIRTGERLEIRAAESFITLPGQMPADLSGRPRMVPGPDVTLRLQAVRLGTNVLFGMSCAPVCPVGMRLKEISPYKSTVLVTHAGESCGYIADDWGCERKTFEYHRMRIQKGYAEPALQEAFRKLLGMLG